MPDPALQNERSVTQPRAPGSGVPGDGVAGALTGPVPVADDAWAGGEARETQGMSVQDFLTDASLAAVCDELSRITGIPVWLRDRHGQAVVAGGSLESGPKWRIVPEEIAARRAAELAGVGYDGGGETFDAPLKLGLDTFGALVMSLARGPAAGGGVGGLGGWTGQDAQSLKSLLTRLATSISEGCEAQVSLRRRVRELGALHALASMIVQTEDSDRILHAALELAMQTLGVGAGSIAVIEDGVEELVVKHSRGLSAEWVGSSSTVTYGGAFRAAALQGEIVSVEDLANDPRTVDAERVRREGLRTLLSTGLMYHGRAIGLMRLYTRGARTYTQADFGLLRSIADQCAAAVINARLRRVREENERVQRQVRLAADVQRRMMARAAPEIPEFDVAARYAPSFELGGDFYDFIALGGNMGVVVGDVVGKGVAAALLMSAVRASLRAHAQDLYHLDEVCARVNAALADDTRDDEFATLWYGVADPRSLMLTYCNAGHNPALVVRQERGREVRPADMVELGEGGMALGIDREGRYDRGRFELRVGDTLVVYTDGLVDALNFHQRRFGVDRLKASVAGVLTAEPLASAARVVEAVFWDLRQFTGLKGRNDDITLVVLRVRGR